MKTLTVFVVFLMALVINPVSAGYVEAGIEVPECPETTLGWHMVIGEIFADENSRTLEHWDSVPDYVSGGDHTPKASGWVFWCYDQYHQYTYSSVGDYLIGVADDETCDIAGFVGKIPDGRQIIAIAIEAEELFIACMGVYPMPVSTMEISLD